MDSSIADVQNNLKDPYIENIRNSNEMFQAIQFKIVVKEVPSDPEVIRQKNMLNSFLNKTMNVSDDYIKKVVNTAILKEEEGGIS